MKYKYPQPSLLIITHTLETNEKVDRRPIPLSHANYSRQKYACFKHSNFFKVNESRAETLHPVKDRWLPNWKKESRASTHHPGRPISPIPQIPTTSFLTATTLIYAIGAGITAAAGTRLVLQLFLVKGFKLYSFQLQDLYQDLYCYLLSLPPRIEIG